jgi:uncharacterized membrane protein YbaN (DUF454 family)
MYNWLINHRIFGSYIYCYLEYRAVPRKTKIGALIFLWTTLLVSATLVPSIQIKIFLMVVGIAVSLHLLTLKTLSLEDMKSVKVHKRGQLYEN